MMGLCEAKWNHSVTTRPTLFILPGMMGHDWRVREFASAVSSHFVPALLKYKDGDGARGLAWAASRAAQQISETSRDTDIAILGYSYGANVAFEAVQILEQAGRKVLFLFVVDPALADTEFGVFDGLPARTVSRPVQESDWRLFLLRLRIVWSMTAVIPQRRLRTRVRNKMHIYGRRWARRGWSPSPLHIPGLIVTSTQLRHVTESRLQVLCPAMTTLSLDARHLEILAGASGKTIAQRLVEFGRA